MIQSEPETKQRITGSETKCPCMMIVRYQVCLEFVIDLSFKSLGSFTLRDCECEREIVLDM